MFGSKLWSGFLRVGRSRLLTSLPAFTYLFLSSIYFLTFLRLVDGPGAEPLFFAGLYKEDDVAKYTAELQKQVYQFAAYGLSILLVLFRLPEFLRFWAREGTLFLIFCIILLTTLVSDNPDRVVINLVHLVFGAIAAWLYFSHESRRKNPGLSAAKIVFLSVLFTQLVSFIWFFVHPDSSIDAILAGRRYGGVANNPNLFGGVCIVAAWALFAIMFSQERLRLTVVFWLIPTGIVLFNAWSTGSATTLVVTIFVFLLFLLGRVYRQLRRRNRGYLIISTVAVMFGAVFWIVIEQNTVDLAEKATESVGKDITVTGRVDLWLVAVDAILERPMLGWSYDNHETVKSSPRYSQPHNHYHNGFLDTLIVGGVLLGAAVLLNFYAFTSRLRRLSSSGIYVYPLVVGFIAACMQNMTEYSMYRNNTIVWMMFLLCFMAAAIHLNQRSEFRKQKRRKMARGKGSKSRHKRYTW